MQKNGYLIVGGMLKVYYSSALLYNNPIKLTAL